MPRTSVSPPDLTTVGGRLRFARERWGLSSSREAADRFGWNENTYKSHELGIRGASGLKEETARRYARAFGVSLTWLMTGTGSPSVKQGSAEREWEQLTAEERELAIRLYKAAKGA